jgi:AcrR family transcriptional regulator
MHTPLPPRNPPNQTRSRERLIRVLDAADEVLAEDGVQAFTTTRIALIADLPIGSIYRFYPDKDAIVEALAVRYWSDFEDLVAGMAEVDRQSPLADPTAEVIDVLATGFRAHPGFLALWYGGLRSERVRDATRPARTGIATSIARILTHHWPQADPGTCITVAEMVVLAGDGLLREAFRRDERGDSTVLEEGKLMLDSYIEARLGGGAGSDSAPPHLGGGSE